MRKTKKTTAHVGDEQRDLTLRELTVADVLDLYEALVAKDVTPAEHVTTLTRFMGKCVDGLTLDDLRAMSPSQILTLVEQLREVNSAFFDLVEVAGLKSTVDVILPALAQDCWAVYSASLTEAMPESGSMDGERSS